MTRTASSLNTQSWMSGLEVMNRPPPLPPYAAAAPSVMSSEFQMLTPARFRGIAAQQELIVRWEHSFRLTPLRMLVAVSVPTKLKAGPTPWVSKNVTAAPPIPVTVIGRLLKATLTLPGPVYVPAGPRSRTSYGVE